MKFKNPYCVIRKDLNNNEIGIPIWDNKDHTTFIHGTERGWRYRWIDDNNFQIKYGTKYFNAHSIDFDFIG